MRLGAPVVGDNEMFYVQVYSSSVWRGLSWDVLELITWSFFWMFLEVYVSFSFVFRACFL